MKGIPFLLLFMAAAIPIVPHSDDASGSRDSLEDRSTKSTAPDMIASGPAERNRVWKLFNNGCLAPPDMAPAPTAFETNICLLVHKRSRPQTRRGALLRLRQMKAIQFYDVQIELLVSGLSLRRPTYFTNVVKQVAAPNAKGRFLNELVSDPERVKLVMAGKRVPLEE